MGLWDFKPEDVIDHRERFKVPKRFEPAVDEIISQIVGKKIYQCDPRVLKLIVKWKKGKSQDSMVNDNFLQNTNFIQELKQVLSGEL